MSSIFRTGLLLSVMTLGAAPVALAQGYFIPPSAPQASAPAAQAAASQAEAPPAPPVPPQLPALPAEPTPPTAVIGLLNVPVVMQHSTAVQGIQAEVQRRQAALSKDAQAASAKIQAEQQEIVADHGKIPDDQLEAKEQKLRNEVTSTQANFEAKNHAIQASGQQALGQVEANLIAVVRQEEQAHGMNLILRADLVVLPGEGFDLTDETVVALNKLLPVVQVPASVVTPEEVQQAAQGAYQQESSDQGAGQ